MPIALGGHPHANIARKILRQKCVVVTLRLLARTNVVVGVRLHDAGLVENRVVVGVDQQVFDAHSRAATAPCVNSEIGGVSCLRSSHTRTNVGAGSGVHSRELMMNIALQTAKIAVRKTNHSIIFPHFIIYFAQFACSIVRSSSSAHTHTDYTWLAHTLCVLRNVFYAVCYIHIGVFACQSTHHDVGARSHTRILSAVRACTNKCRVAAVCARCQIRGETGNASGIKFRAGKRSAVNRHFRATVVGWHIHTLDASVAQ